MHRGPIVRAAADSSPSFRIRGAGRKGGASAAGRGSFSDPLASLRLDRVDSRTLLRHARTVYFRFLASGSGLQDPLGVVIGPGDAAAGRVVFESPVLLPDESFVPLDLLRLRQASRNRAVRASAARSTGPLGTTTPLRSAAPMRAAGDV